MLLRSSWPNVCFCCFPLRLLCFYHLSIFRFPARPKISEVMEETKFLLQQSRERLVITYVESIFFGDLLTYFDIQACLDRYIRY